MSYRRLASLKTADDFLAYADQVGAPMPFDRELEGAPESPLATPLSVASRTVGNRFAILPMEGWDGTPEGGPTDLTRRRWQRFGQSGAKLIWGGEAVAVAHNGRANPHQLWLHDDTQPAIAALREELIAHHADRFGQTDDLLVGLQLTHSGRFARPNQKDRLEPMVLYRHPLLEERFSTAATQHVLSDDEVHKIIGHFVEASVRSADMGYDFVDIKHCHGYLGHETLSSVERPGPYGGSFENRTRFLREIVEGIRRRAPGLLIGVRLSAIDWVPFRPGEGGIGQACAFDGPSYTYSFGGDGSGHGMDLSEPLAFLDLLSELEIPLVCISVGSPYYNPHIQRPAYFPPTDGYLPPEDPLVGVARQIDLVRQLRSERPGLIYVGSGYSYLQQWLPNVAQAAVREGAVDSVGLGRMVLSYPELPADVLAGRPLEGKRICRTFSDCTSGPRNGMISGCFPLDPFYKALPEGKRLVEIKSQFRQELG